MHLISFQTFFVQAFKIVIDSWKFTMLLLYILWDDWLIFMISGSKEQLQKELEYTLLKPDCHCWVNFKNAIWTWVHVRRMILLWDPYPSHHNGLFSPLLVLRDFAAWEADQSRSEPLQVSGSASAGRVICGTDPAKCVSVPGDFLRPQVAFPPGFYPLSRGVGFIARRLRRP